MQFDLLSFKWKFICWEAAEISPEIRSCCVTILYDRFHLLINLLIRLANTKPNSPNLLSQIINF